MSGSVLFKARQLSLSIFRALPMWLATTAIGLALISPPMFLQRGRAALALNEAQRQQAHEIAEKCPITATPEEYRKLLTQSAPGLSQALAFQYYAALAHVEMRERILQAYGTRRDSTDLAIKALTEYIARCHARLRADDFSDIFTVNQWPSEAGPAARNFSLEKKKEGLHVYRLLLWPEHLTRPLALKALALAEEDLQRCEKEGSTIDTAHDTYDEVNVLWLRWLNESARVIEQRSESSLRAEVVRHQGP